MVLDTELDHACRVNCYDISFHNSSKELCKCRKKLTTLVTQIFINCFRIADWLFFSSQQTTFLYDGVTRLTMHVHSIKLYKKYRSSWILKSHTQAHTHIVAIYILIIWIHYIHCDFLKMWLCVFLCGIDKVLFPKHETNKYDVIEV